MFNRIYRRGFFIAPFLCLLIAWSGRLEAQVRHAQPSFVQLVQDLSEPSGFFDTDNLISNEKSYLHVLTQLEQRNISGGVYIGVGPDQNFSYIARIRPAVAFVVDIRRDNLLLHLLFKALFGASRNRMEYLCLLTGRPVPDRPESWNNASIENIVAYVGKARPVATEELDRRLQDAIRRFGVPVPDKDLATIGRFHAAFILKGLSLQFQTLGRPIQPYNPTYQDLLLETDRNGRRRSYVASEEDFQFVKNLEASDRVIPVVGDFAGPHALAAIGDWMAEHKEHLSAFYVSNVEDYLFRGGTFAKYVENLKRLPHTGHSVLIRSVFGRQAERDAVPGYYSVSTLQNLDEMLANFAAGKYRTYSDLLDR